MIQRRGELYFRLQWEVEGVFSVSVKKCRKLSSIILLFAMIISPIMC